MDYAYDLIPNQLDPFDWDTYQKYDGTLLFGVTNAMTGEVEYMNALEMDRKCMMLRATCAIPILFPEIKINDIPYFDGGLADPIPIQKAIDDGYNKHVLVLTRPKGYRKQLDSQSKWAMKLLKRKYPKLVELMQVRIDKYNETLSLCERLEEEGKAFIFRPEYPMKSMEKDVKVMRQSYEMGYNLANSQMEKLTAFYKRHKENTIS